MTAIAIAVVARLIVFVAAIFWPIPDERGQPVSPLLPVAFLDFQFYLDSLRRYIDGPVGVFEDFVRFYQDASARVTLIVSGPVFPLLMYVTGFDRGHYLPLALAYLAMSGMLCAAWLVWLNGQGVRGGWLLAFALIPNPLWFTLVISTDLLFAAEFAAFFFAYFSKTEHPARKGLWIVALILMVLTRPNSFSVVVFVALDASWSWFRQRRVPPLPAFAAVLLLVSSGLYLYPYFVYEMNKAGNTLTYFGHVPFDYLAGLFEGLPESIDRPASWIALAVAKVLYFTGLRPSYGLTIAPFVFLRAAAGLVLLPGLLLLLLRGPRREALLIALYIAPFLLGPAQDRYYLAVYPLLFLYGVRFYQACGAFVRLRSLPDRRAGAGGQP